MIASTEPIDVVIAWVDGSDPDLNKKRIGYLNLKQKKTVPTSTLLSRLGPARLGGRPRSARWSPSASQLNFEV